MTKLAFTGDCISCSQPTDYSFSLNNRVVSLLKSFDVVSGNLEMSLCGNSSFASTFCGGEWLAGDEDDLRRILKYGFSHFNLANNHSMDYSYSGLLTTMDILRKNGIQFSGAGKNYEESLREARICCKENSIAIIGCTASCDDAARAGNPTEQIQGRPGVNMLRHSELLYVTEEEMKMIDRIADETKINARFLKSVAMGINSLDGGIHRLGRLQFVLGDKTEKKTKCNQSDLSNIITRIELLKDEGIKVIAVHVHSHDIKGETDDTPDDYLVEFAHKAIDAGATMIIGTGTHQLKGVEVYRHCPIFYSLGNFIFDDEYLKYWPSDFTERFGVMSSISPKELWDYRSKGETVGLEYDPLNYRSIIPSLTIENGVVTKVVMYPIELNFNKGKGSKGYPHLASVEQASSIFNQIYDLSCVYKTDMELKIDETDIPFFTLDI